MKNLLLGVLLLSMTAFSLSGEVETKTFENISGYCENGKITSITYPNTSSYLDYIKSIISIM